MCMCMCMCMCMLHVHVHVHVHASPDEHPVEQISALTLHWIAVHIVAHTSGLHVAAVGAHFGFKALGACFNHTGYDVQVRPAMRACVHVHVHEHV